MFTIYIKITILFLDTSFSIINPDVFTQALADDEISHEFLSPLQRLGRGYRTGSGMKRSRSDSNFRRYVVDSDVSDDESIEIL